MAKSRARPSPKAAPGTVRAAVSLGLLSGLMALVCVWALAHERVPAEVAPAPGSRAANQTQSKDVLTGRPLATSGRPVTPASGWGSPEQPIRIRVVPSNDEATALAAIDDLLEFLRARTGYVVEGAILRSYGLVVEEIVRGQADIAFLTAASYARARFATEGNDNPEDGVEAILTAVMNADPAYPGSDLAYRGAIIVAADSDINELADLDAGRTIAMGNRTSGASSILPSALLATLGLRPRIQRFEGYPVIISAVLQGAVDAGCIWWSPPTPEFPQYDARITMRDTHPDVFEKTRIIAYTPWLPNEPVVARAALPASLRAELARAIALYAATKASTDNGRRALIRSFGVLGYIPATNADYEPLMEIIERAFARDPEGRADFMAGSK